MEQPPLFPPERSGSWAKDHCDYLLDSIDAQLSQLQVGVGYEEGQFVGQEPMAVA